MKTVYLVLISLLITQGHACFADKQTKNLMQQVVDNYIGLIPYIYGAEKEDQKDITKKLKALKNAFQSSKHNKMLNAPNFAPLAESMRESFQEIYTYYNTTYDDFSKYRLLRLTTTCIACHSQLPLAKFKRVQNKYKNITHKYIKEDIDKAYTSFFFRDYKKAAFHLKNYFQHQKSVAALSKLMKVYLVNLNDKSQAIDYLSQVALSKKYSAKVSSLADTWKHEINKNIQSRPVAMSKEAWVRMLISKYLVPRKDDLMDRISNKSIIVSYQMQRVLYNYLVYHPNSTLVPELLYWLGILENKERNIDLYTLGDMYFEQCIIKYPNSHIAPRCYGAYKDAIHEGFTGSSGTHIPQEFVNRLKKYKKLVFNKETM